MWLILRYVILDLQDRVLPNLELSRKEERIYSKIYQTRFQKNRVFLLYGSVAKRLKRVGLKIPYPRG